MKSVKISSPDSKRNPDVALAAACGLYCGSCGIYLATQESDTEKLLQYAIVLNQSFNDTLCDGCRAKRKSAHCSKSCPLINCTLNKGIQFCGSCNEHPCKELKEFQSEMPHRVEILESQNRLKEIGIRRWLIEMNGKFVCYWCNAVNSAYDIACRKCEHTPSCDFVAMHMDIIEKHFSKE